MGADIKALAGIIMQSANKDGIKEYINQMACGGRIRRFDDGGYTPTNFVQGELPGAIVSKISADEVTNYTPANPEPVYPDMHRTASQQRAIDMMSQRIKKEENSKLNLNGGYNVFKNTWYPHTSQEGGTPTIGYGIKYGTGRPYAKFAETQGYLTDDQAERGVVYTANEHYDDTRRLFDEKYGKGQFDLLDPAVQSILGDYTVTGTGINVFPNFFDAMKNDDYEKAVTEYVRKSGGKPLGRNKGVKAELDSLKRVGVLRSKTKK